MYISLMIWFSGYHVNICAIDNHDRNINKTNSLACALRPLVCAKAFQQPCVCAKASVVDAAFHVGRRAK